MDTQIPYSQEGAPRCLLSRGQCGPQFQPGVFGEDETLFPVLGIKPRFLSSDIITVPVELFPYYKTECQPIS